MTLAPSKRLTASARKPVSAACAPASPAAQKLDAACPIDNAAVHALWHARKPVAEAIAKMATLGRAGEPEQGRGSALGSPCNRSRTT